MSPTPYVSRINQIDAYQLDDEVFKLLQTKIKDASLYFPPGKVDKWRPELNLLLRLLIWNFSLRVDNSTFGQRLLNLNYRRFSPTKSVLYFVLLFVPKYLEERSSDSSVFPHDNRIQRLKFYVEWVSYLVNCLQFVNLIAFLHKGSQPNIVERVLDISSESSIAGKPRTIGYSYMTRELLWHSLIEVFASGLPMINFHFLIRSIARIFARRRKRNSGSVSRVFMSGTSKCAYCRETPVLPSHAGCGDLFCYYCLQAHFEVTSVFECPECSTELSRMNFRFYQVTK